MRRIRQVKRKEIIFELDEWSRIEQGAKVLSITTSEYIRRMTLEGKVVRLDLSEVAPLVNGMKTISNNMNQIARKANETNSIYASDIAVMKEGSDSLCRLLSRALSELQSKRV